MAKQMPIATPDNLAILLANDDFVQIAGPDSDGVLRGKLVAKDKFLQLFETEGKVELGFCGIIFGFDIEDTIFQSEVSNTQNGFQDIIAKVDLSTYRRVPWAKNHPFFLFNSLNPVTLKPVDVCPRSLLSGLAEKAGQLGYRVLAGTEYEFVSFKIPKNEQQEPQSVQKFLETSSVSKLEPLTEKPLGYGIRKSLVHTDFYSAVLDQSSKFDCPLESFHAESGPGMYEAAIGYDEVVRAADKAITFKHMVKSLGAVYGDIQPTFMAKPVPGRQGLSGHVHMSMVDQSTGKNVFARDTEDKECQYADLRWISDEGRCFLAGILIALPEIMPMIAPNINSYKRLIKNFAAPISVSWGLETRLSSIRIIAAANQPKSTRFEVRVPGADSCPYYVLSAILAAGLHGIKEKIDIFNHPGCPPPLSVLLKTVSDDNIPGAPLPRSLSEANARFRKSEIARALFGDDFVRQFAFSRDYEIEQWYKAVTDWELKRYIDAV